MGLRLLLATAIAAVPAASPPVEFLLRHQQPSGAFAESDGRPGPALTAWAVLGLRAAGAGTGGALQYLIAHEAHLPALTDVELVATAESSLGRSPAALLARIHAAQRPNGRIGPSVNSTVWGILALRQAGERAPRGAVRFVLRQQARSGGWAWYVGGQPDSNDTAAAVEALRAAGVGGRPVRRGLAYLRRLRRPDGSFRYSRRYVTTPVWVTSQVLPALHRRAFPLPHP